MAVIEIFHLDDPALSPYARLTENQLRNRLEPDKGIFIAESLKVIRSALEAGFEPVSFLMERRQLRLQGAELSEKYPHIPLYVGERELLSRLTGYALTRGILCAMKRPPMLTPDVLLKSAKRLALLENIVDSSNMGAIFRSARALGVEGILLSPSCADPLNRRCVRVSMGTVFTLPWAYITEDTDLYPLPALQLIHQAGFATAALALREDTLPVQEPILKQQSKLVLLLGTEGDGLAAQTIDACTFRVKIPMAPGVDSLNVAAAAAVAFWELCF